MTESRQNRSTREEQLRSEARKHWFDNVEQNTALKSYLDLFLETEPNQVLHWLAQAIALDARRLEWIRIAQDRKAKALAQHLDRLKTLCEDQRGLRNQARQTIHRIKKQVWWGVMPQYAAICDLLTRIASLSTPHDALETLTDGGPILSTRRGAEECEEYENDPVHQLIKGKSNFLSCRLANAARQDPGFRQVLDLGLALASQDRSIREGNETVAELRRVLESAIKSAALIDREKAKESLRLAIPEDQSRVSKPSIDFGLMTDSLQAIKAKIRDLGEKDLEQAVDDAWNYAQDPADWEPEQAKDYIQAILDQLSEERLVAKNGAHNRLNECLDILKSGCRRLGLLVAPSDWRFGKESTLGEDAPKGFQPTFSDVAPKGRLWVSRFGLDWENRGPSPSFEGHWIVERTPSDWTKLRESARKWHEETSDDHVKKFIEKLNAWPNHYSKSEPEKQREYATGDLFEAFIAVERKQGEAYDSTKKHFKKFLEFNEKAFFFDGADPMAPAIDWTDPPKVSGEKKTLQDYQCLSEGLCRGKPFSGTVIIKSKIKAV